MTEVAEVKKNGLVLSGDAEEKHTLENLNRFLSLVGAQDDRAMVLSLATFIEDTQGRLLIAYFRDCKATRDLVEGFSAPLGTLGSRTKAVYSFGLVTEAQYKDMEILRKVRNQFAHNWEGVSLARNDIQALIGQLSGYTIDQKEIIGGNREEILGTLSSCCMELQIFVGRLISKKTEKAPDVSHRLTTIKPTGPGVRRHVD
jgi:DNA-binding MltR family transcriptional regulator